MVRLTSPNLNYLIVIGAVFIYLSVVFHGMPFLEQQLSTVYCNLQQWLFSFGNALCFAVVLAKMGRVYYIFSDPTPNRKVGCLAVLICSSENTPRIMISDVYYTPDRLNVLVAVWL